MRADVASAKSLDARLPAEPGAAAETPSATDRPDPERENPSVRSVAEGPSAIDGSSTGRELPRLIEAGGSLAPGRSIAPSDSEPERTPLASGALRIERPSPPRLLLRGRLESGYDGNVRLLTPVEVAPGEPVADGFAGLAAGLGTHTGREGLVAAVELDARRFLRAENGTLGGGGGRLGWRFALGPVRLEPAVDVSAFGWTAFPGDRHVAVAFSPEAEIRRGRLSIRLAPTVLARAFTTGADRELWLRADAWLELDGLMLGAVYVGSDVDAMAEPLSRQLHRGDLIVRLDLPTNWDLTAQASLSSKRLPHFPAVWEGGRPGRRDRIVAGKLQARWAVLSWLSLRASVDALASASSDPVAEYERFSATLTFEGRWDPLAWMRRGPRPVRLVLSAPEARTVEVAGEFTGWQPVALVAGPEGWSREFELPVGEYRFGFLVDGAYVVPGGVEQVDDGLGGRDGVVRVIE